MSETKVAPYGGWQSPISADLVVQGGNSLVSVRFEGGDVYWLEGRPAEGGRVTLMRCDARGQIADASPPQFNLRTRVHEYGGGAYTVAGGHVYFSNFSDNLVYIQAQGGTPQPLTHDSALRYADFLLDAGRGRLICVREDHRDPSHEAVNTLVALSLDGSEQVLQGGNDFYSSPRLSPDGGRLAWLTWHHPNLPWDGTELWVGKIAVDGRLSATQRVTGGDHESIFQPEWAADGSLYYTSDRSGWWNIYRWHEGQEQRVVEAEAEFGKPQWVFGLSSYAFVGPNRLVCTVQQVGIVRLVSVDTDSGAVSDIPTPYTAIADPVAEGGRVGFIAASPTSPTAVVMLEVDSGKITELRRASDITIDPSYISVPQAIEFPTEGGMTAHAFFYPPDNRDYTAPQGELPPLIVKSHGGPTSASVTALNLGIQFWTSRGIAVLDVNYGGSSGYGREYRERLYGQWGVVDVDDCANGATYLAQRGLVDGERLAITGGSAGGYTTLCAVAFRDTFKAGASHYGIGDLETFAQDTHKFESRYMEQLVGPYPQERERYYQRSPIHFAERIACPLIIFQGLDDKVVPPNQAEDMVAALHKNGTPYAYVPFEGEGHGFRNGKHIKRALEAELYFYSRVFRFPLAEPVEPVTIEGLS